MKKGEIDWNALATSHSGDSARPTFTADEKQFVVAKRTRCRNAEKGEGTV